METEGEDVRERTLRKMFNDIEKSIHNMFLIFMLCLILIFGLFMSGCTSDSRILKLEKEVKEIKNGNVADGK